MKKRSIMLFILAMALLVGILATSYAAVPIWNDNFDGYPTGTNLHGVGGWKGWFVTIPATVTYANPKGRVADGSSLTVTPRFGRLFDLGNLGSMAVFLGGNYLDSDITIDGSFTFAGDEVPALEGLALDYRIGEKNTDHWNVVTGFNWDISKRLSWTAEYDGFTGSREALISSLNLRF